MLGSGSVTQAVLPVLRSRVPVCSTDFRGEACETLVNKMLQLEKLQEMRGFLEK